MGMEEKINLAQIKDISEGDRAFEEEIIGMYLEDTKERIQNLKNLLSQKNWLELKREAHSLKGSSGNIGVTITFNLCKELEAASLNEDESQASQLIQAIDQAAQDVKGLFQTYLENN